jgi:hypothetical protein
MAPLRPRSYHWQEMFADSLARSKARIFSFPDGLWRRANEILIGSSYQGQIPFGLSYKYPFYHQKILTRLS